MRESLKIAKQKFKDKKVIAMEVGVNFGGNALEIYNNLNIEKLILLDNWQGKYANNLLKVNKTFPGTDVIIIRGISLKTDIVKYYKYDYIYLDNNHSTKHVINELDYYFPLVKKGGILAGHDYDENKDRVASAVQSFSNNVQHKQNTGETVGDWWLIKE